MDTNEIFVDIKGFEGRYQISNCGNVKSFVICKDGKLLNTKFDKDGYPYLGLRDGKGNRTWLRINRLVCLHFIPNPNNYKYTNHKDNNTGNNHVDNLEWCTMEYNNQYRFSHGNASHSCENHPLTKLTNQIVKEIYLLAKTGKYTEPELAEKFNTTRSVINKIRLKYRWFKVTDLLD